MSARAGPRDWNSQNADNTNGADGGPACVLNGGAPGGIEGTVYYLPPGSAPLNNISDYFTSGIKDTNTYYWANLDIPTTYYTAGFPQVNGQALQSNSNQILTENYAIKFQTQIGLSSTDTEGDYEFATISDDGSVLSIANSAGTYQTIVNNDGLHQTQLNCATQTVHLDSTTELNAQIEYYQGPRYYVAMIVLWKKIAPGQPLDTMYCGQSGDSLFFTPTTSLSTPATPSSTYNALLARGWTPLNSGNFTLPGTPNCI